MGNRFTRAELFGCEKKTASFVLPVFTKLHVFPLGSRIHAYRESELIGSLICLGVLCFQTFISLGVCSLHSCLDPNIEFNSLVCISLYRLTALGFSLDLQEIPNDKR